MNPSNPFGSNEPALPNVPNPPQVGMGPAGMPQAGTPMDQAAAQAAPMPTAPPPANSWLPPTVPVQAGNAASGGTQLGASSAVVPAPAIADDGDIIEKEWVEKAKHIVAQTRQDPYKQARELHRFKAEYLQKRYNKKIEAVED